MLAAVTADSSRLSNTCGAPAKTGLTRRMHAMKRMNLHIKFYRGAHTYKLYTDVYAWVSFYVPTLRGWVRKKASVSRKQFSGKPDTGTITCLPFYVKFMQMRFTVIALAKQMGTILYTQRN